MRGKKDLKHRVKNTDIDVLKIKTERNNLGVIKTMIVLLLIMLQLAIFLVSYIYFFSFYKWFMFMSVVISILTCIYVISTNKNSQSKPIWVLFLLSCFSFGYLVYFISDERFFWNKHKKRYKNILEKSYEYQNQQIKLKSSRQVEGECNYLYQAGNFVSYSNTDCKYYSNGTMAFDKILEDLEKAKKFIFIEFFIISDGVLLNKVLNILEEKVKAGVEVRIIYDDFGSHGSFKRKTKVKMRKAGIQLHSFNKLLKTFSVLLNYRDHRKIIIIDGEIAYTGGINLADEYVNEKRIHGYWKDAGIRLNGSAVDGLTLTFLRQWAFVSKMQTEFKNYLNLADKTDNNAIIVPYADGLEYDETIGKNAYINMIMNSNKFLYIMSPYFVIDDTIKNILINKAKSGVDVRIILPEVADKKIVYIISRNNSEKLIQYGIRVYTMKHSFVHSKVMLNENSAIVGSINMDLRSFYQQFESSVYLNDIDVMEDIEQDFLNTFKKCTLLTKTNLKRNSLLFRIIAGIVNLISPFM